MGLNTGIEGMGRVKWRKVHTCMCWLQ